MPMIGIAVKLIVLELGPVHSIWIGKSMGTNPQKPIAGIYRRFNNGGWPINEPHSRIIPKKGK